MIVPIRIRGRLAGILRFEQSRVKHSWKSEEENFGCQIAEIIAGVFLVHEINEKETQLRAHEETIAEMTRLTNHHTLLTEALHHIIQLTGARSAMLFENFPARREIVCQISINTPISFAGMVMKYGEGAAGSVAELGRSLRVQDYPMWSGRASQLEEQHPFTSALAVPVRFQGQITGVIEVAHHDVNSHFSENQRRILEKYAHNVAVILEQTHQVETIASLTTYAQSLEDMISASTQAGRLETYLAAMLAIALNKFGLKRGVLRVENNPIAVEMSEEEEREINQRLAADQAGFNAEIAVGDWRDYSGSFTALAGMFATMDVKASLMAPLWNDLDYRGYLAVFSASPRVWRDDEISLIKLLAAQTVLTVEKVRGGHERETVNHNLERLNSITSDLNHLLTFDDAIARVGQGAVELMNAEHAAIFLKNPDGSLSVPWQFAIADTHLHKIIPAEDKELVQLLLGNLKPIAYQNLRDTTLPTIFKKYMGNSAIASLVCLPLIYTNQTVGTIVTFHNFSRSLSDLECDLLETFTNQAAVTLQNAWMFAQIDRGYTDLALALAKVIDTKEEGEAAIGDHTRRVARWAEETGRKLGLNDHEIRDLHWAALLHDIGKSSIPSEILEKSAPLSEEERRIVQRHAQAGAEMIKPLARFQTVSGIIRTYRERYDGRGYPDGLKGEDIPLPARVLAVADAFGSITHDRPYHRARSEPEALREIRSESGRQFDPLVVKSFLEIVGQSAGKIGRKSSPQREARVEK